MTGANGSTKESYTDVLIIGAGPAGLMAHMYLSELGIDHKIIDKRGTRALNGRADGFHTRTAEIWESFGILDKLRKYGVSFGEFAVWAPSAGHPAEISRQTRKPVAGTLAPRLEGGLFSQGFVEATLIEAAKVRKGPTIQRGAEAISLAVEGNQSHDKHSYPVTVQVHNLFKTTLKGWNTNAHSIQEDGTVKAEPGWTEAFGTDTEDTVPHVSGVEDSYETIHAKYLIGADGANSWVRHQLPGFEMSGSPVGEIWGVIDIIPLTDFPDIRKTCTIRSSKGTILMIPRERGLVRLYIQLPPDYGTSGRDSGHHFARKIIKIAQDILFPYKLEYKYCDWCSEYKVAHRVANKFSYLDRVHLAGDSVHSHTPKGGQGMNTSQQDAYNLAFKLAGVIRGRLHPSILATYESERLPIAQELIDLDTAMSKIMTSREKAAPEEVEKVYNRLAVFGSWGKLFYEPNHLVASASEAHPEATKHLKLGSRFPDDSYAYNQANRVSTAVQSLLESDGQWRLLVFAGGLGPAKRDRLTRINSLGDQIKALSKKFPSTSNRLGKELWLRTLLLHAGSMEDVESTDFHSAFFPYDPVQGHDYHTIFADREPAVPGVQTQNTSTAHEAIGVDIDDGALILVRPDQIVSWVGRLADLESLGRWLGTFMITKEG